MLQQMLAAHRPHGGIAEPTAWSGKMIAHAIARRRILHFPCAPAAYGAVGSQRTSRIAGLPRKSLRRHGGILDRHCRALRQKRQHRVRGVAEQRDRSR